MDKLLHLSTRTRASQTRDASFLNGFKTLLTNDILSQNYASLQITSKVGLMFHISALIFFYLKKKKLVMWKIVEAPKLVNKKLKTLVL